MYQLTRILKNNPSVTIVLTSYNHEKFIGEAIESVLHQTYAEFELIIWDDASTDGSWEIICSYKDERIKAFRNEINERKVLNKALLSGEVKGKYVAVHHSDDVWEVDKLEKQVSFLNNHPEYAAVFTGVQVIQESGLPFEDEEHFYYKVFDQPNRTRFEWLRFFIQYGNALCHPSVLIRKSCYDEIGLYSYSLFQIPDLDYWVRLTLQYEIFILNEKLVRFRILNNEKNVSGDRPEVHIRGHNEFFKVFKNFNEINSLNKLVSIFPEIEKNLNPGDNDLKFLLGRAIFDYAYIPAGKLFGLELMMKAIDDRFRKDNIFRWYNFTPKNLCEISGSSDIFLIYSYNRLAERNNSLTIILESKNRENSLLIGKIEEKNRENSLLSGILEEKENLLKSVIQSKSWQLTKPIRIITSYLRNIFN